ncbi:MAG: hypothetical protein JO097_14305 [Acidobacteriaceae bacterium]|nr:hypothetical protein [Acidobacteriaceae bacterium]MBV9294330.1 hypothetical protein [Acidobacteriaceae bacterium]MBV9764941.1 hypothetical protein [Acidobacteriaceae bacterium]
MQHIQICGRYLFGKIDAGSGCPVQVKRRGGAALMFDPDRRRHEWHQHLKLRGFVVEPLTAEARVPARVLRLNIHKPVVKRRALMIVGRYPRE